MKKYISEAAYEWCGVCTKWQHHAESPGADFSHLSTEAVWGENWASAVSAVMPWAPGPPALLAAQGEGLAEPHWTALLACHGLIPPVALTYSCWCLMHVSSDTKSHLQGVPAPRELRAQAWELGTTNRSPVDTTWKNPPRWCRRGQADADAWPTKPSSALFPIPNFQKRTQADSAQHQQKHLRPNQSQLLPNAAIHVCQKASPGVCPLTQPAFLQPGFSLSFTHTFQHHSKDKMMCKPLTFFKG